MSVQDGSEREFVFVAFRHRAANVGATVVLEICGSPISLAASTLGASNNIEQEIAWFRSMSGDPTADYPHACPETD
jgi:hypothetical protein